MPTNLPAVSTASSVTGPLGGSLLPGDIEAHRIKLLKTRHEVHAYERVMDGYLFGVVGADPVISLIPVVGDVVSGLIILWVVSKAAQVRMSMGERLVIVGLGAVDTAIGMTPVVGDVADVFFRAHAWSAKRVQAHIDTQLAQIEAVHQQLAVAGPVADDHPHLTGLRDALFRGGKTKQEVWTRLAIIGAACLALLGYCSYQDTLRNDRIAACKAGGGWLCEWRN